MNNQLMVVSRRDLLRSAAAVGSTAMVSGVLSACGSSSASSSSAELTAKQVSQAQGTIKYLGWQYYQTPEMDSGPVKAHWTYISNVGQLITAPKLPNAFDAYNPGAGIMLAYFAEKAIAPIPTHLLANYEQIPAVLRKYFVFNGKVYGVPFQLTPSLNTYDLAKVPEPKSINDLLKPVYKGLIGLPDNDETVIPGIARGLGIDIVNKPFTHDVLDQAMAFLNKLKPSVKTFYEVGGDVQLMQGGDIAFAFQTYGAVIPQELKSKPSIKYNYLASILSIDCLSVTPWADMPKSVSWINHQITVPVQSAIAKHAGSAPVLQAAYAGLSGPGILPLNQMLAIPPVPNLPPEPHGNVVSLGQLQAAWSSYKQSF
jgi:spermidine/putrescine-binding protein